MTLRLRSAPPDCHHVVEKRATSHPDEGDELLIGVFITPGKSRALEMQTAARRSRAAYSRPVFAGEHGLGNRQLVRYRGTADVLGDPRRHVQLIWRRDKRQNGFRSSLLLAFFFPPPPAAVPVCGGSGRPNTSLQALSRKEEL